MTAAPGWLQGEDPKRARKLAIDAAWQAYLSASRALPRSLSWRDFCARDAAMFADYLDAERAILAEKGPPRVTPVTKSVPSEPSKEVPS